MLVHRVKAAMFIPCVRLEGFKRIFRNTLALALRLSPTVAFPTASRATFVAFPSHLHLPRPRTTVRDPPPHPPLSASVAHTTPPAHLLDIDRLVTKIPRFGGICLQIDFKCSSRSRMGNDSASYTVKRGGGGYFDRYFRARTSNHAAAPAHAF